MSSKETVSGWNSKNLNYKNSSWLSQKIKFWATPVASFRLFRSNQQQLLYCKLYCML